MRARKRGRWRIRGRFGTWSKKDSMLGDVNKKKGNRVILCGTKLTGHSQHSVRAALQAIRARKDPSIFVAASLHQDQLLTHPC